MEASRPSGVLAYMWTIFVPTLAGETSTVRVNVRACKVKVGMPYAGVVVAGRAGSGNRGRKQAVVVAAPASTTAHAMTSRIADVVTEHGLGSGRWLASLRDLANGSAPIREVLQTRESNEYRRGQDGDVEEDLVGLIARMRADLATLNDARRFFHATYLRTTEAVADEIDRGGFVDNPWVSRWDVAFAKLYTYALDADRRGDAVPGPWRIAFGPPRDQPHLPPLRHVLFGLNAHINYDLPQALLAVITSADFDDPTVRLSRQEDHEHVDVVLQARVGAEDDELTAVSRVTLVDRLLRPANRMASRRFLAEARRKVWHNATVLDRARRVGAQHYAATLAVLEALCEDRVRDLTRPGPVLLTLARKGFGLTVPRPG